MMTPILIILGLLAIGVAIVALATRQGGPGAAPAAVDPETGWNDSITPEDANTGDDPFAHAPAPETGVAAPVRTTELQA